MATISIGKNIKDKNYTIMPSTEHYQLTNRNTPSELTENTCIKKQEELGAVEDNNTAAVVLYSGFPDDVHHLHVFIDFV